MIGSVQFISILAASIVCLVATDPTGNETSNNATNEIVELDELTKQPKDDPALKIRDLFEYLNEPKFISSAQVSDIQTLLADPIQRYDLAEVQVESDSNKNRHYVYRLLIKLLKNMVDGSLSGRCDYRDLWDRTSVVVGRFSVYNNLYNFIRKMNIDHAEFCLKAFSRELSYIIDDRIRPSKDFLESLHEFRNFFENKRSQAIEGASSSSANQMQLLVPLDGDNQNFVKKTVLSYIESKEPTINLKPGESLYDHSQRFSIEVDNFMKKAQGSFCESIYCALHPDFYDKFVLLFQLDPLLDIKADRQTLNWFRMLQICKTVRTLESSGLWKIFLSTKYSIAQIEQILFDTSPPNQATSQYSAMDIDQLLQILRQLYRHEQVDYQNRILDVSRILDTMGVRRRVCDHHHLDSMIRLHTQYAMYPNLDRYFKAQMDKQIIFYKPILKQSINEAIEQISGTERRNVTNLRHKTEKFLDPGWSEKELWQLNGEKRSEVFDDGLTSYIKSHVGSKFTKLSDLETDVYRQLGSSCRTVKHRLFRANEMFTRMVRYSNAIDHKTHAWMSNFALCDNFMQNLVNWAEIYRKLTSCEHNQTNFITRQLGGLLGTCGRGPINS